MEGMPNKKTMKKRPNILKTYIKEEVTPTTIKFSRVKNRDIFTRDFNPLSREKRPERYPIWVISNILGV
jgi:hypothetical protein